MNEDFVSEETARLAKKANFNEPCLFFYYNAEVFDKAKINGKAEVFDNAQVYGNAEVWQYAKVYSNAHVFDHAWISGGVKVCGEAKVCDYAVIVDNAEGKEMSDYMVFQPIRSNRKSPSNELE